MAAFAQLKSIDDPRDNLDKARLHELEEFAIKNGIKEIFGKPVREVPAILIRRELRQRGMTNIRVPYRPLGGINAAAPQQEVRGVDAGDDLARQFAQQQTQPPPPAIHPKPDKPKRLVERPKQEINLLREECQRLGIKMERRDGTESLKAKIAAHGKDASQLRQ